MEFILRLGTASDSNGLKRNRCKPCPNWKQRPATQPLTLWGEGSEEAKEQQKFIFPRPLAHLDDADPDTLVPLFRASIWTVGGCIK